MKTNPFELFQLRIKKNYPSLSDEAIEFLYNKYTTAEETYKHIAWIRVYPAGQVIRDCMESERLLQHWLEAWEWYSILENVIIVKQEWEPDPGI